MGPLWGKSKDLKSGGVLGFRQLSPSHIHWIPLSKQYSEHGTLDMVWNVCLQEDSLAHYRAPGNTGKCLLHRKVICSSDLCRVLLLFMVISLIITPQGNTGYNLEYLSTVICKIYGKKRFMEKKISEMSFPFSLGKFPFLW